MKVKKRKGRRLLAVLLAAALAAGMVGTGSVTVKAAETATDNSVLDLRGTGITSIPDRAYGNTHPNNETITTIYLPNTLKSIGTSSFWDMESLTTVIFEENSQLESIGLTAFKDCDKLKSFTIPDTVTTIGKGAFMGCNCLSTIEIGENSQLQTIGEEAFRYCKTLTGDLCFPETLKSIGKSAFLSDSPLKSIEFKNPNTSIGAALSPETIIYAEPGGQPSSVEQYARERGCRFNRPASKLMLETSDDWTGEFSYGDKIDATALKQAGLTAKAVFLNDGSTGKVELEDCVITGVDSKKAGTQTLTFIYYGKTATLPIHVGYDMSLATVSVKNTETTYTGEELRPALTVSLRAGVEKLSLQEGRDYKADYTNNVNAGTATVTLTGKGDFRGTATETFTIEPASLQNGTTVSLDAEEMEYTGDELRPGVKVFFGTKELVRDTDYTLKYENNTEMGTATVIVSGKGNYCDMAEQKTFRIVHDITEEMEITLRDSEQVEYTGYQLKPEVVVMVDGEVLDEDSDYTLTYKNNINSGNASVVVKGIGLYKGQKEQIFTIHPQNVEKTTMVSLEAETKAYTGKAWMPEALVELGGKTLRKNTDYTLTYADNTNVGKGTVTVTFCGNYTGTVTKEFTIFPADISEGLKVSFAEEVEYSGEPQKPDVKVMLGQKVLEEGVEYTLGYKNNTEPGTAEVTVTGKGNYTGTVIKNFLIIRNISDNMKITLDEDELEYTGKALRPMVKVTSDGKTLVPSNDYTTSFTNNINAGTAKVTVTCKGLYRGTKTAEFTITVRDIGEEMDCVLAEEELEATGGELMPKVTVKLEGNVLVPGDDYTVSYKDNINPGKATVTVTCKGNYKGTAVLSFTILQSAEADTSPKPVTSPVPSGSTSSVTVPQTPAQSTTSAGDKLNNGETEDEAEDDELGAVKNLSVKSKGRKTAALKWKKSGVVKGYQIQYSTSKKFKGGKTKTTSKTKCTIKNLKPKKIYYFRVRCYAMRNGEKVYGDWSTVKKVKVKK